MTDPWAEHIAKMNEKYPWVIWWCGNEAQLSEEQKQRACTA